MTFITQILAIAAQAAPVFVPQPPPIVAVATQKAEEQSMRVNVELRQGDRTIWSGPMNVTRNGGANFSQNKSDSVGCSTTSARTLNTSLSISLRRDYRNTDAFAVNVNWSRPADEKTQECADDDDEVGTRTLGLNSSVELLPGQSATIQGDAGMTVRLSRR